MQNHVQPKSMAALRYIRMGLELLTMLGVVVLVVVYAQTAGILPSPDIGEGQGIVSRYGMGTVLTGLFLAAGAIIGVLMMISRFPKLYKYPVQINAGNVELQYIIAKVMLSAIQLVCAVYFCTLIVNVYQMRITLDSPEFRLITVFTVGVCAIIWLVYLLAARANK